MKREDSEDDDIPLKKPTKKAKAEIPSEASAKKQRAKPAATPKREDDEDDEGAEGDDGYQWWNEPMKGDGTNKWTTLEHNGVVFPPPFKPLPKNVKLKYDGVPVFLAPEAEEVAYFYGSMLNSTVNTENPTFNKNFFSDFKEVLDKTGHGKNAKGEKIRIKESNKLDFRQIWEHFDGERQARNARPSAEKKAEKAARDETEKEYKFCKWDGRKQQVGNFKVEPPGLFRGRGQHPKTGQVKKRVMPEQVTINIGKEARVPPPPEGHRWKEVKHDRTGTWLAMWQENINGNYKYVMLAATSDIKGQSDFKKFEKARELKVCRLPGRHWYLD